MWIAACDDDPNFICSIDGLLRKFLKAEDHISTFNNGSDLIDVFSNQYPPDMALIDIEMPGLTGIESAREIRKVNSSAVIVIITNFIQYAIDGYSVDAVDYLLKPVDADKLKRNIDRARIKSEGHRCLWINSKDSAINLPYNDIMYLESYGRALYVHTGGSKYKINRKISDMGEQLKAIGFFRIHQSYIVNLSKVKYVNKSSRKVVLADDTILPVGDRKLKELMSLLIDARR